jgi:hypothetical protein
MNPRQGKRAVNNLLNAIAKKLTAKKKPVVKLSFDELPEEVIVKQVRTTLILARDYYAARGRRILAVDLQCHLEFFDEAVKFDVLEHSPVLLPTDKNRN